MLKRKRQGKTNYRKRLALLKSGKTRLVIRITNRNIIVQAVNYDSKGDRIICSAYSGELKNHGWNLGVKSVPAAYLTGYALGGKIIGGKTKNRVREMIGDFGFHNPKRNTRLYSVLKGIVDSGIKVNVNERSFPKDERIKGMHIKQDKIFEVVKKSIENGRKK